MLLGVWISVLLEDAMNFSGESTGLFVPRWLDERVVATTRMQRDTRVYWRDASSRWPLGYMSRILRQYDVGHLARIAAWNQLAGIS